VDHFSKWAEAWAIPNHEAPTIAKVLVEQLFARFGTPSQILSNMGGEYEGKLMKELCRCLNVDKLRMSSYKPSTNGAVERLHRTLNSLLGKVVSTNQRNYEKHLPTVIILVEQL